MFFSVRAMIVLRSINHRWNWWGGSKRYYRTKPVLWADVAHPINVGGHGDPDSSTGEVIENAYFP